MSSKSKISMRVTLIALASCTAASTLVLPAAAQSSDGIQAFMTQRHLHPRAPGAEVTPTGQYSPGPTPQPPRDAECRVATPAPFFPTPIQLAPSANAVPSDNTYLNGVSCTSPGNCVAVGSYTDPTSSSQPMIITETDGVWHQGVEATLPANAATAPGGQNAFLFGVYCTSVGNCVATGGYNDANGNGQPMVVTETNGAWAPGVALNLPANAATAPGTQFAFTNIVTCPSPGNCAITGGYSTTSGSLLYGAAVFSQRNGVWGRGVQIALPPNATTATSGPTNPAAGLNTMGALSCFSAGNCVAGGQYTDTNFNSQPMITTETNGVWSPAIELTLPANAATAQSAQNGFLANLVCFRPGSCTAGGGYNDINGNAQPAVFNQTHGVWTQGFELILPANAATAPGTQSAYLNGFNCTSRGNCFGYSAYNDLNGNGQPLVIAETGGVWTQGVEPPLPANAATAPGAQNANINGASCTSPGVCVAVGQYTDNNGFQQPMAYTTVPALSIETANLPPARVGSDYQARLLAAGGAGANTWSVSAGALPAGLRLNPSTGEISGSPTASGTFSFTITVSDTGTSPGQEASTPFTIFVSAGHSG
ncbi:MAG TPA: putative Ig domain-containing protein [Methylocella sp.]|nr:putative Ig domain-containing protein [Methylocella sp.]